MSTNYQLIFWPEEFALFPDASKVMAALLASGEFSHAWDEPALTMSDLEPGRVQMFGRDADISDVVAVLDMAKKRQCRILIHDDSDGSVGDSAATLSWTDPVSFRVAADVPASRNTLETMIPTARALRLTRDQIRANYVVPRVYIKGL